MIYSLKEKEGMLRLYHRKESIAEAAYCSYFGLRQKSYRFEAETAVFFVPENEKVTCIKGTEMKAAGIRDFSAVFPDEYTYRGIP